MSYDHFYDVIFKSRVVDVLVGIQWGFMYDYTNLNYSNLWKNANANACNVHNLGGCGCVRK